MHSAQRYNNPPKRSNRRRVRHRSRDSSDTMNAEVPFLLRVKERSEASYCSRPEQNEKCRVHRIANSP